MFVIKVGRFDDYVFGPNVFAEFENYRDPNTCGTIQNTIPNNIPLFGESMSILKENLHSLD